MTWQLVAKVLAAIRTGVLTLALGLAGALLLHVEHPDQLRKLCESLSSTGSPVPIPSLR